MLSKLSDRRVFAGRQLVSRHDVLMAISRLELDITNDIESVSEERCASASLLPQFIKKQNLNQVEYVDFRELCVTCL
jgi:hypothetical protein